MQPQVQTCTTYLEEHVLTSQHFSTFISLVRGVAFLIHMARSYKNSNQNDKCRGLHRCNLPRAMDEMDQAKDGILKATQKAEKNPIILPKDLATSPYCLYDITMSRWNTRVIT